MTALIVCATDARAQVTVHTWTNAAGGDFHDPANWSTGAVPSGGGDVALFDLDATYTVTAIQAIVTEGLYVQAGVVTIDANAGGTIQAFEVASAPNSDAELIFDINAAPFVFSHGLGSALPPGYSIGAGDEAVGRMRLVGQGVRLVLGPFNDSVVGRLGLRRSGELTIDGARIFQDVEGSFEINGAMSLVNSSILLWDGAVSSSGVLRVEEGAVANAAFWSIDGRLEVAGGKVSDELQGYISEWLAVEWQNSQLVAVDFNEGFSPSLGGVFEFGFSQDVPVESFVGDESFLVIDAVGAVDGLSGQFDVVRLDAERLSPGLGLKASFVTSSGETEPGRLLVDVVELPVSPRLENESVSSLDDEVVGLATADFNDDGAVDLAVTHHDTGPGGVGAVQRLLRDPASPDDAPTFTEIAQLPVGRDPSDVLALLLDADPYLDLVVSNQADDTLTVFLGEPSGGFLAPATVTGVGDGPFDLDSCDIDGDGDLDIVVANLSETGDRQWQVFENDGSGGLTEGASGGDNDGRRPKRIKPADIDPDPTRDGSVCDLVVLFEGVAIGPSGTLAPGRLSVFLNNGDGTFATTPAAAVELGFGSADLALADLDLDGRTDIVVAETGAVDTRGTADLGDDIAYAGNIVVIYNDSANPGVAQLSVGRRIDLGDDQIATTIVALDVDSDGDPDLAAVVNDPGVVRVFENIAAGGDVARASLQPTPPLDLSIDAQLVRAADLNGDGDDDLLVIGASTGATRTAAPAISASPNSTPQPPDFNGDGEVDGADLGLLLGSWGRTGLTDLNGDGMTDGADVGLLLASWSD